MAWENGREAWAGEKNDVSPLVVETSVFEATLAHPVCVFGNDLAGRDGDHPYYLESRMHHRYYDEQD